MYNDIVIDRLPVRNNTLEPIDEKTRPTTSAVPKTTTYKNSELTTIVTNSNTLKPITMMNSIITATQRSNKDMTTRSSTIRPKVITSRIFTKSTSSTNTKIVKKTTNPKIYLKSPPTTPKMIRNPPISPIIFKKIMFSTPKITNKVPSTRVYIKSNSTTTRKFIAPKIYNKTPSTTPKIIIRKPVVYSLKPLLPPTATPRKLNPIIIKPNIPNEEGESNDVIEVSIPKDNDDTLLITPPSPEVDYSKEYWSDEAENPFDTSVMKNVSETLKLLTQSEPDMSRNNVMAIVVSSIGSIIFVVAGGVLLVRYYRYRYPRGKTFFSSGVSQSDVRFFSNDENLDFTLDNELYGTS